MVLLDFRDFLFEGLANTLKLCLAIVLGSTAFAIILACGLSTKSPLPRRLSYVVAEIFRDIPLIVTVLLIYFVMPQLRLSLDPFWSSTLAVSLWGGANGCHAIRAGLLSVPVAQRETMTAFGLRGWKGLFLVILPQAMPVILPPYIGLVTAWVQASSLGAVVGVHELFRSSQVLIEQTTISTGSSPAFLVYGMILIVYFVLCWIISCVGRTVERWFNRHHLAPSPGAGVLAVTPVEGRA